ncbi:ATP-grasp domain-containing protein [Caballeronia sp. J97]|uniref:ATP-grasp domain-containing protein n=1 Tax=Caballeronia sp. J97 TaxID=2805429 RepID=UPI002AB08B3F|nr:ATP-grasp domain-containing protein [Caballeronia sp. J97]
MNVLILHRIPYQKIDYHRGIDHERHEVTYFGKKEALATIPLGLRCKMIERPGAASAFEEGRSWLGASPQQIDRIISLSEYELLDAAYLREWLGVPGAEVSQVSLARDKMLMKEAVSQAGLRVPGFVSLPDFLASDGHASWRGKTVLKPLLGASSEDVVVFSGPNDAFAAIAAGRSGAAQLDSTRSPSNYEVEEFIEGAILHFDGLVHRGCLLAMTASEYIGTCLSFANGEPLGSYHYPFTDAERQWVQRVLSATAIHNGSFHLEAIRHGPELVFLEIANRAGGADVVRTFELATGIHLPTHELRILIDEPYNVLEHSISNGRWHGWFVFPGHHLKEGMNRGLVGANEFRGNEAVVHWHELDIGAPLVRDITYQSHEVPLAGVVATRCAEDTRAWIERLFRSASYPFETLQVTA